MDERNGRVQIHPVPDALKLEFMNSSPSGLPKGGNVFPRTVGFNLEEELRRFRSRGFVCRTVANEEVKASFSL